MKRRVPKTLDSITKNLDDVFGMGMYDLETRRREVIVKMQQEIEDLKSRSKKLCELVAVEKFTVDDVVAESHATSFTPDSEMIVGGSSPVYGGGFTSRLVLKVSPDNKNIPVRTLHFEGISVVSAGDYISARIPRYEEKCVDIGSRSFDRTRVFYLDRSFNPEESAIELALLSADGRILRRDRAVNYKRFVAISESQE